MGMTISGMPTGSAAPAGGGGKTAGTASGTSVSAGGAAAIFGQSLQQLMGGAAGAGASDTPASPLLAALQQLISAAGQVQEDGSQTGGENAKQLDAKLDDLLQQLDSLDEQLEQNPELMPMLQGWIQQAQTLLNPQEGTAVEGEAQPSSSAVNGLASNPATLKFALQDTVAQLIDLQKNDQADPKVKVLAQQALASLEQTVEAGAKQTNAKQTTVLQTGEAVQIQENGQAAKTDQTASKTNVEAQAKTTGEQTIVSSKGQAQQGGADAQKEGDDNQEAPQDVKPQTTITAGELALRANGMTPAKPVEAVPVQRVPQEVAKLAVDRLEILQKEGFTEAKISLTPDHLGKVDIRLTMHAGQLVAHFVTEHAMAKDMLEQQMVQLRGTLQGQGITVERIEVTQSSSLQSQMDQNGSQNGSGQQQQRRSRSREEGTDDARLTAELGEELGEWLRQKTAAQAGSSFIAEA